MKARFRIISMLFMILLLVIGACSVDKQENLNAQNAVLTFIVNADTRKYAGGRYDSLQYFLGNCEAVKKAGKGAFMVSVGDIDPPEPIYTTVKKVLGKNYPWYPIVGNHEAETTEDMAFLRELSRKDLPNILRFGPKNGEETTYSADYKNTHIVALNEYYNGISDIGTNGDVDDSLYNWLQNDLKQNNKPFIFVFGHEPLISIPDYENGRHRHKGDNLDNHPKNNHRFQQLLKKYGVTAYICGHTHNVSYTKINGLWQLDAGHSRGIGDRGAPSSFLKFLVGKKMCKVQIYRDDANGGAYRLVKTVTLD